MTRTTSKTPTIPAPLAARLAGMTSAEKDAMILELEYKASPEIQKEFRTLKSYRAFRKAEAAGHARIFAPGWK